MEYVVAVIVSLVLISILFFSLRSTVKRIDINTKKYFIDKLQDYDYLIEEKKKVLNELNEEIKKNKEILSKETNNDVKIIANEKKEYYGEMDIPKCNCVYYELEGGSFICVRPSGTEPKLKIYYSLKAKNEAAANAKLAEMQTAVNALLEKAKN